MQRKLTKNNYINRTKKNKNKLKKDKSNLTFNKLFKI